jgi:hypothetical protein
MLKVIFIVMSPLFIGLSLYAQPNVRQSSVRLMAGAVHNRFVDEGMTFDRQKFSGTSFKFMIDYTRRRNTSLLTAGFEMNEGMVKLKDSDVSGALVNGQLALSYLFGVNALNVQKEKGNFYIGPKVSTIAYYLESKDRLDNESALAIHGLYIHAFQYFQITDSKSLEISLALPTVGFSKRIVLDGGLNEPEDTDITSVLFDEASFGFIKSTEFGLSYLQRLSPLTHFSVRYRFAYMSNSDFGLVNFYSNELLVGFKFYFRNE